MKAEHISPDELSIFNWDIRKDAIENRERLKKLIEKDNYPISPRVRQRPLGKEVWDGVEIVRIAKEMNKKEIPIINYGQIDDKKIKAEKTKIYMNKEDDINKEKLYEEWYRLYDDEEMEYNEISELYDISKSKIYNGISTYVSNQDEEKEKDSDSEQISLESWNNNDREQEEEDSSNKNDQTSPSSSFNKEKKSIKVTKTNIIDKKPKEIDIMVSSKLHVNIADDIEGTGYTIPSKIVEILNLYYGI